MTYVLLAAALLVLFWPSPVKTKSPKPFIPKPPAVPPKPVIPGLQESLHCCHIVRRRLAMTEKLGKPEQEALDPLVLSVLSGTDPNERA